MPLVPMLPLGVFGLGLEALPSPTDLRLVTDEDDVHRCGRCQAEFTALEDFVQHKLQKVCQRASQEALPATPVAAALLDQEVSPPPVYMHGCAPLLFGLPWQQQEKEEEEVVCWDRPLHLVPYDTGVGRHLILGEEGSGPYHQEPGGGSGASWMAQPPLAEAWAIGA